MLNLLNLLDKRFRNFCKCYISWFEHKSVIAKTHYRPICQIRYDASVFALHIITPRPYPEFNSLQPGSDGWYRICFKESDFQMHLFEVNSWFFVRVFPLKFFKNSIREFKFARLTNVLKQLGCGTMKHFNISNMHKEKCICLQE